MSWRLASLDPAMSFLLASPAPPGSLPALIDDFEPHSRGRLRHP